MRSRRTHLQIFSFALPLLLLSACQNAPIEEQSSPQFNFHLVDVLETYPAHGAQNILRDTTFKLTFSHKLDAYSAFDFNYQLWTESGQHIGAEKLISSHFIPHPSDPNKEVTQIRIRLREDLLPPYTNIILTWAAPLKPGEQSADVPHSLVGLVDVDGNPAKPGAIFVKTGGESSPLASPEFRIESCSPGRPLYRGGRFDFFDNIGGLINPFASQTSWVSSPKAPLRIYFNDRLGFIGGIDNPSIPPQDLGDIPPTPLDEFPQFVVAVFDKETNFAAMFEEAIEDFSVYKNYSGRIPGVVYTENNRRTLVFEPSEEYPDSLAQFVIYMVGDFYSMSDQALPDVLTACGFPYSSNVSGRLPFFNDAIEAWFKKDEEGDGA